MIQQYEIRNFISETLSPFAFCKLGHDQQCMKGQGHTILAGDDLRDAALASKIDLEMH